MQLRTGIADEINQHHDIAIQRANEAIHHASQAGKLLLEVKAALPHGQFLAWVEKNIRVSARQAQRYMAVAQGKPTPIRTLAAKSDTVSHLSEPTLAAASDHASPMDSAGEVSAEDWLDTPVFCPTPGYWHLAEVEGRGTIFLVPSLEYPELFHLSLWDGKHCLDHTKKPFPAWIAEAHLWMLGIEEPLGLTWQTEAKPGLSKPFGV